MRWRVVGGTLAVVTLTIAVVALREQVPPQPLAAPAPAPATTTAPAADEPGLPAFEPVRAPRWRTYPAEQDVLNAAVGQQYLLHTRTEHDRVEFVVQRRDTGEQVGSAHVVPQDEAPWSGLLHQGWLLISHGYPRVKLVVVDLATSAAHEFAPLPGYSFSPHLLALGDEVLLPGRQFDPPRACVLAIRPVAGSTRVVWCAPQGRSPGWLYAGADEVVWPEFTDPPSACPHWFRVRPGGEVEQVPGHPVLCGARELLSLGGWQVTLRPERAGLPPLITATDGAQRLVLGTAVTMTACGRHVYWTAVAEDTVYRWRPGAGHREIAYHLDERQRRGLTTPRCVEGVLSLAETLGSGARMVQLRSLGRP